MTFLDQENMMFKMVRQGRRLPGMVLTLIVLVGLVTAGFAIPAIFAQIALSDSGQVDEFTEGTPYLVISFSLMMIFLWIWLAGFEKRPFSTLGFPLKSWFKKLLLGSALGFGMASVTVGLMYLAGGIAFDLSGTQDSGIAALSGAMLFLLVFGLQGGGEEVLFRGWLLQVMGARYRPWAGVLVPSLVFVAFHAALKPVAIINLFLFALFLTFYCLKEGSIWGVCGWHATWNWTQGHFYGLEITGHGQEGGTVLDLKTAGSEFVSGGGYGPEASIMCTLVLGLGVILLVRILMHRHVEVAESQKQ